MLKSKAQEFAYFTVRAQRPGEFGVFEQGFDQALAEFTSMESAEQYAVRAASSKSNWKVDVYDEAGVLAATYNSEDDAMQEAALP